MAQQGWATLPGTASTERLGTHLLLLPLLVVVGEDGGCCRCWLTFNVVVPAEAGELELGGINAKWISIPPS